MAEKGKSWAEAVAANETDKAVKACASDGEGRRQAKDKNRAEQRQKTVEACASGRGQAEQGLEMAVNQKH